MNNKMENVLSRYFGGSASNHDMQLLEIWISSSAENQLHFDELTKLYVKLGGSELIISKPNTEIAKKSFMAYISKSEVIQSDTELKSKHIVFYKKWMYQAAGILLLIIFSLSVWKLIFTEPKIVIYTKTNQRQEILPDKTQVRLSKNSKIIYRSNFANNRKIIQLEGEANFIVGQKGEGKLQVEAGGTFIEDIGTVFTVEAYPNNNLISVIVKDGEVHFFTKENQGMRIKANETGVYNKKTRKFILLAQQTNKSKVELQHFEFIEMELKDVISTLCNAYNIDIRLSNKSIAKKHITANFDSENVDVILKIIAETLDLKLEKNTNYYLLSKIDVKTSE